MQHRASDRCLLYHQSIFQMHPIAYCILLRSRKRMVVGCSQQLRLVRRSKAVEHKHSCIPITNIFKKIHSKLRSLSPPVLGVSIQAAKKTSEFRETLPSSQGLSSFSLGNLFRFYFLTVWLTRCHKHSRWDFEVEGNGKASPRRLKTNHRTRPWGRWWLWLWYWNWTRRSRCWRSRLPRV